jgi:hypothetical protein
VATCPDLTIRNSRSSVKAPTEQSIEANISPQAMS